jgi:hypothetical protein
VYNKLHDLKIGVLLSQNFDLHSKPSVPKTNYIILQQAAEI